MTSSASDLWNRHMVLAAPRTRQIVGVLTFTILTALTARMALLIPGTLIPFSFQPMVVLLAGGLLGARLGSASQILYISAGLVGLPVFALGSILAPSGGYIMAYPVAALAVGALSRTSTLSKLGALLLGLAIIYAGGVAWLSLTIGAEAAFTTGVLPFIASDMVKVVLALLMMVTLQKRTRSLFAA